MRGGESPGRGKLMGCRPQDIALPANNMSRMATSQILQPLKLQVTLVMPSHHSRRRRLISPYFVQYA